MAEKTAANYPPEVEQQINTLQGGPSLGGMGGQSGALQAILKMLGGGQNQNDRFVDHKIKPNQDEAGMSTNREADPYYPSQNGNDEQYSSTTIDDMSKASAEFTLQPLPRKGKKAKAMAPSSLLKNANQFPVSALFGGILDGFEKKGTYPDVDPSLLFDYFVTNTQIASDCTEEEILEVKEAFVKNWNPSTE